MQANYTTIDFVSFSPLLASSESGSTRHQQASEMFQGLESHSVLHVLHKSVSLAHLPEKEVFELLKKRPVFSPLEASLTTEGPTEVNAERLDEPQQAEGEDVTKEKTEKCQDSEIHPEVQRDIFLYHSYCALRNFMEAVTSSVEDTAAKDNLGTLRESADGQCAETLASVVTSEGLDENSEATPQQQEYGGLVANKLNAGKHHLSQVYPLTYRVEILENVFSLLFGTFEDVYEGRAQHNESDDLETMDEETRSLTKSSRTGSWESLASSVDLSFDAHGLHSPFKDQEKTSSPATSLSSPPDIQHRQKDPATPSALDSASRRQLFKSGRSESDSALLKKVLLEADEKTVPVTSQDVSDPVNVRQSENDSFSGNLHSSKGSSRPAVADENDLKCEFVIDDEIVPDVLKTLKECLMELNTAKFTEVKKGTFWRS